MVQLILREKKQYVMDDVQYRDRIISQAKSHDFSLENEIMASYQKWDIRD